LSASLQLFVIRGGAWISDCWLSVELAVKKLQLEHSGEIPLFRTSRSAAALPS
jgi:hypothetical protein